jgi:ATP-dependent Lon protease
MLAKALKRVGTSNPVILLDEIDKMGTDARGDPAAALLEVGGNSLGNRLYLFHS